MTAELFQQLLNWLSLGSIYSLLAIGFTLLFGVLNIVHFSHGDVALLAPFVALAILQGLFAALTGVSPSLALLIAGGAAIVTVGGIGVALDKLVIGRFRDAPTIMALVATVALGIVLRELIRHFYPEGSSPHAFPSLFSGRAYTLFTVGATIVLVGAVYLLIYRTPIGVRIRAVSQDREAARLMGIDPERVFRVSFFVASATGAVAGLFYSSTIGVARFDLGVLAGLMGFSAAVIGGLGSMAGAIVGGLLLSGLETIVQAVIPNGAAYRLVFAFILVIVVLVFRPIGLLGKPVSEKV